MKEILTIIGKNPGMKHHYCLDGIDLDNIPYSRMGEAVKRLKECTDVKPMALHNITKTLMKSHPNILYCTSHSNYREYWTWIEENNDYVIYRIGYIKDDDVWGIKPRGNAEYLKVYNPADSLKEIDPYSNYCEGYDWTPEREERVKKMEDDAVAFERRKIEEENKQLKEA